MTDATTHFPPAMLVGIAAGLEDPELVAAKFGYTPEEYRQLEKTDAFKKALAATVRQMEETGLTPATVEHAALQEMLTKVTADLYHLFKSDTTEPDVKAKLASLLYKRDEVLAARLNPKQAQDSGTDAERFVINITIPAAQTTPTAVIDVTPETKALEHED